MTKTSKHIVIDARIRRASTGRPVDRLLHYLQELDTTTRYSVLLEPHDPYRFVSDNFTAVPCPYKQFSLNPLKQIAFSRFLKKLKPDLVHFTLTGQAPLFYSGKNVTITHDLTMLRYARAGRLPKWLHSLRMIGYRWLFKKGNRSAARIMVPTNFVKEDLTKYLPSVGGKITVTYEAGEPPMPVKSIPLGKGLKKPFIFHVGSPFPHKNIQNLVMAFEKLKETHPKLKLVLAGKKEHYFVELEKWLEGREYSEDILLPGFISDGELKWLYENAECYVLPSLSEGFGLPGLEAMAHSCPVVSSNATCLPEVYGKAAVYFDPENTEDMARAVDKVLASRQLQKELVEKGQKQLAKYSWEKMSKQMLEIYNSET